MRVLRWLAIAPLVATIVAAQPPPEADVEILSPEAGSYISGPTTLKAGIVPADAQAAVTFFVDGRQICAVAAPPYECEWNAGPKVTEHLVRVVAQVTPGGRVVRTLRTKALSFGENVDVDAVQVTVTVTDERGQYVRGIPRSAFRVFEDGRPQAITNFASEDIPLELVAAVDISGSMTATMPKLKDAVRAFLGAVPPRDQVSLLGFNDSIFALARKTTDLAERMRAVDRLAPWGATALYDVMVRSLELLGRQGGRKAIVVFSDGEDQGSHVTIEQVERRLQSSDATLYMIGQGRAVSTDRLKLMMKQLVDPTGGRVFATNSIDELHGAFNELLEELSNQYLIGYQPADTRRDGRWREIRVDVAGHRNVRARQGYRTTSARP